MQPYGLNPGGSLVNITSYFLVIAIVQSKYEKTHHKLQQKQNCYHLVGNFVSISKIKSLPKSTEWNLFKFRHIYDDPEKNYWKKIIFYIFFRIMKTNLYLQAIWFISITIPYKRLCRWLDVWVPNYMKDFTQKYANSRKNIFDFILLYGGVFIITLSILNRYNWLMA